MYPGPRFLGLSDRRPGPPIQPAKALPAEPYAAVRSSPNAGDKLRRFRGRIVSIGLPLNSKRASHLPPFGDAPGRCPQPERTVGGSVGRCGNGRPAEAGVRQERPTSPVEPARSSRTVLAANRPQIPLASHDQASGEAHQAVFRPVAQPGISVPGYDGAIGRHEPQRAVRRIAEKPESFVSCPAGCAEIHPYGFLPKACHPERAVCRLQKADDPAGGNGQRRRLVNRPGAIPMHPQGSPVPSHPERTVCACQQRGLHVHEPAHPSQADVRPRDAIEPVDTRFHVGRHGPDRAIPALCNAGLPPGQETVACRIEPPPFCLPRIALTNAGAHHLTVLQAEPHGPVPVFIDIVYPEIPVVSPYLRPDHGDLERLLPVCPMHGERHLRAGRTVQIPLSDQRQPVHLGDLVPCPQPCSRSGAIRVHLFDRLWVARRLVRLRGARHQNPKAFSPGMARRHPTGNTDQLHTRHLLLEPRLRLPGRIERSPLPAQTKRPPGRASPHAAIRRLQQAGDRKERTALGWEHPAPSPIAEPADPHLRAGIDASVLRCAKAVHWGAEKAVFWGERRPGYAVVAHHAVVHTEPHIPVSVLGHTAEAHPPQFREGPPAPGFQHRVGHDGGKGPNSPYLSDCQRKQRNIDQDSPADQVSSGHSHRQSPIQTRRQESASSEPTIAFINSLSTIDLWITPNVTGCLPPASLHPPSAARASLPAPHRPGPPRAIDSAAHPVKSNGQTRSRSSADALQAEKAHRPRRQASARACGSGDCLIAQAEGRLKVS